MRKKLRDELLIGSTVVVHPQLDSDPAQRQGMVGEICGYTSSGDDTVLVVFEDGKEFSYHKDSLLILYPRAVILQGLVSNGHNSQDRACLFKIQKLLYLKKVKEAIKLAVTSEHLQFFCTTDCDSWQDMMNHYKENVGKRRIGKNKEWKLKNKR